MKKSLTAICLLLLILCTGCVDFHPVYMGGVYESEDGRLRIYDYNDPGKPGDEGELVLIDGSIQKISFSVSHGDFTIDRFREDGLYSVDDIIYRGKARERGDTVTLYVNDGSKIVLKKVADLPESSIPTATSDLSSQ